MKKIPDEVYERVLYKIDRDINNIALSIRSNKRKINDLSDEQRKLKYEISVLHDLKHNIKIHDGINKAL